MNKFSSIFGQILQIFSKKEFYKAVIETATSRGLAPEQAVAEDRAKLLETVENAGINTKPIKGPMSTKQTSSTAPRSSGKSKVFEGD